MEDRRKQALKRWRRKLLEEAGGEPGQGEAQEEAQTALKMVGKGRRILACLESWQEEPGQKGTIKEVQELQEAFDALKEAALCLAGQGGRQDVLRLKAQLERLMERYQAGRDPWENWWQFAIGIPRDINWILALLGTEAAGTDLSGCCLAASVWYTPIPWNVRDWHGPNTWIKMTGANLADTAFVCLGRGLLFGRDEDVRQALQAVKTLFPFVTEDDGFYRDGSFIQHHFIPYAGGYGQDLLAALARCLFLFDCLGTLDELKESPDWGNLFFWLENAFLPFLYGGMVMDLVRGRKISRQEDTAKMAGEAILKAAEILASYAEPEAKKRLTEESGRCRRGLPFCEGHFYRMYGSMDRAVVHTGLYSAGLSMHSSRVGRFSTGNGENLKGWHTGDGMLYVYTGQGQDFAGDYWALVDYNRLPGITTDGGGGCLIPWNDSRGRSPVAGGAVLEESLAACMELDVGEDNERLLGKKAWFFWKDRILCLASGIAGGNGNPVETVLENRQVCGTFRLIWKAGNCVSWQREGISGSFFSWQWEGKVSSGTCLEFHEEGSIPISWEILEDSRLRIAFDRRTGSWREINADGGTEVGEGWFLSICI